MSLPWLHRLSVRARLMLLSAAVSALVLGPVEVGADIVTRKGIEHSIQDAARDAAAHVTADIRAHKLKDPIPEGKNDIDLIQVVTPEHQIIARSNAVKDQPPLSDVWPSPDERIRQFTTPPLPNGRSAYLTAIRVTPDPNSPVVYAGRHIPGVIDSRLLEVVYTLQVALLVTGIAWLAWRVAGRALQPVEAIRAELASITVTDLSRRVPEPPGGDEIARLASTANATLARLQRSMDQQRQFAADASHELRTPITGIRAQLESAKLHPEDAEEAISAALRDTTRLETIVADLLLLARIGTSATAVHEEINLGDLVTQEIKQRIDRIPVELGLAANVEVVGVRTQLARVVKALIDNACRHARSTVRVEVRREGDEAVLTVTNDGETIPMADRERIFERFTRIDSARSRVDGGTGLGLAIAREVSEAHHGSVVLDDDPSGHVRFTVRLPLARDADSS